MADDKQRVGYLNRRTLAQLFVDVGEGFTGIQGGLI